MNAARSRVAFVTTGLFRGGAEAMLYKLLAATPSAPGDAMVVSLGPHPPYVEEIEALGVSVISLNFRPPRAMLGPVLRLRRTLARFHPDVVQGWMYHGNIAALLGRPSRQTTPVLWSIRQTVSDLGNEKPMTARLIRLGARLSGQSHRIIYNSRVSATQHEALGYDPRRTVVIPNGFDTTAFRPDPQARERARKRLGIGSDTVIIGLVARAHAMKDHAGFLRAAAALLREGCEVAFVLVGRGVSVDNPAIAAVLRELDLGSSDRIRLLHEVAPTGVAEVTPAFDIACSASAWGDAFPNVLGEAMSCGIPCVSTNVGDAAWIVGDCGLVVPPSNPAAMGAALRTLLSMSADERAVLGAMARARVQKEFDINVVAQSYNSLFVDAAESTRKAGTVVS